MSKPETDTSWHLIEIRPAKLLNENGGVHSVRKGPARLLVVRHFFPDARNHKLLAAGSKDACFAALRLMGGR